MKTNLSALFKGRGVVFAPESTGSQEHIVIRKLPDQEVNDLIRRSTGEFMCLLSWLRVPVQA